MKRYSIYGYSRDDQFGCSKILKFDVSKQRGREQRGVFRFGRIPRMNRDVFYLGSTPEPVKYYIFDPKTIVRQQYV